MKVMAFRALIDQAERKVHQDIQACVSKDERVVWFGCCFKVFNELMAADCPRANNDDLERREQVQDRFASLACRYETEWNDARRKYLDQPNAGMENRGAF